MHVSALPTILNDASSADSVTTRHAIAGHIATVIAYVHFRTAAVPRTILFAFIRPSGLSPLSEM